MPLRRMVALILIGVVLLLSGLTAVAAGGPAEAGGWGLIALVIGAVAMIRIRVATAMAAFVAVVAGVAVAAAPSEEPPPAEWMRGGIEAGRESIWWNYDLVRNGSPLAFSGAICRADGAFLAFYDHNRYWIWPERLVSEVPADSGEYPAGSTFAGGHVDALQTEYGPDLFRYFAEHGEVPCESR